MNKILMFASLRKNGQYEAEEIIDQLDSLYNSLEYADVADGECQVWEYPSGKIFDIVPDREVEERYLYTTPDPAIWLPKLKEKTDNLDKISEAYQRLNR